MSQQSPFANPVVRYAVGATGAIAVAAVAYLFLDGTVQLVASAVGGFERDFARDDTSVVNFRLVVLRGRLGLLFEFRCDRFEFLVVDLRIVLVSPRVGHLLCPVRGLFRIRPRPSTRSGRV